MFNRYLNDEKILSTFGTIFIHFILVILFLLIQIKFSPVIEEFTEVSLAGGFEAPPLERLRESQADPEELQQMDDYLTQRLPEEINLPERRELILDEQKIIFLVFVYPFSFLFLFFIIQPIAKINPIIILVKALLKLL